MKVSGLGIACLGLIEPDFRRSEVSATAETCEVRPPPERLRYLTSTGSESGLPYGVSAEFIYLGDLRQRFAESSDIFELEHVTPYLATKYGKTVFSELSSVGKSHYRTTIDNFDDYHIIVTVQGGDEPRRFQPSLKPRTDENQAQLGPGKLFQDLKPSFSRDPLNAYILFKLFLIM